MFWLILFSESHFAISPSKVNGCM